MPRFQSHANIIVLQMNAPHNFEFICTLHLHNQLTFAKQTDMGPTFDVTEMYSGEQ